MPDSAYQADLAYIHHAGYGDFTAAVAPGVLAALREDGIGSGTVVDLGCGSGLWARALAEAGYDVEGVDASPAMIALARLVAPKARLHLASLHEAELPSCRAVTSLGECIGYLDGESDRIELSRLAARVHAALQPGGLFMFDLHLASSGEPMQYRTWRSGEDWCVLVDVLELARERKLRREIIAFRQTGFDYRRSQETHWVQLFTQAEVEEALAGAGFSVTASRCYGEFELAPGRMAFIARKRSAGSLPAGGTDRG